MQEIECGRAVVIDGQAMTAGGLQEAIVNLHAATGIKALSDSGVGLKVTGPPIDGAESGVRLNEGPQAAVVSRDMIWSVNGLLQIPVIKVAVDGDGRNLLRVGACCRRHEEGRCECREKDQRNRTSHTMKPDRLKH